MEIVIDITVTIWDIVCFIKSPNCIHCLLKLYTNYPSNPNSLLTWTYAKPDSISSPQPLSLLFPYFMNGTCKHEPYLFLTLMKVTALVECSSFEIFHFLICILWWWSIFCFRTCMLFLLCGGNLEPQGEGKLFNLSQPLFLLIY